MELHIVLSVKYVTCKYYVLLAKFPSFCRGTIIFTCISHFRLTMQSFLFWILAFSRTKKTATILDI